MVYERKPRRSRSQGGSPPSSLPSIGGSGSAGRSHGGHSSSASLRGSHHSKVPDINNQQLNVLLPKEDHPEPYYVTRNVVFSAPRERPPWLLGMRANERAVLEAWNNSGRLRDKFIAEFIRDALFLDLSGIVSGVQTEALARNKEEAQILAWLENHVVTDVAYDQTERIVWTALWDEARKMGKEDVEELEKNLSVLPKQLELEESSMRVLRQNYTKPLSPKAGQPLLQHQWRELLYHLNKLMQRGSLVENYAIRKMQELIITQVAAKVVLDDALRFMEDEMSVLDEEERLENPPRKAITA